MNKHRTSFLIAVQLCSIVLLTLVVAVSANAQTSATASVTPPSVPTDVQVPTQNKVFLVGHAVGTQNYVCLPSGSGVAYPLFTPQAVVQRPGRTSYRTSSAPTLPRRDRTPAGSTRRTRAPSGAGRSVPPRTQSSVTPGAIPWLLIQVKDVGAKAGPTGGDKLTRTTFIQRLNTVEVLRPRRAAAYANGHRHQGVCALHGRLLFHKDASHQGVTIISNYGTSGFLSRYRRLLVESMRPTDHHR
jgi:hypothetical protein